MGVPRRACGGRRSPKKFVLWAVVVVGFFALSVKDVRESVYESPGDGKKETREMMDGNDDGKMMGGADNEGESEIEINEKPKIEKQKVMSKIREQKKNGDGDGDGERRQDENNGDHNDDGDENTRDNNDDDDDNDHDSDNGYSHNEETNINGDIEKNNQKIDQIIAMNEKESETKDIESPRETNIEDKQEKDKDEEEKRENQQGEEVVVNEIKPDQDKPIDEPEIDDRNRMENGNSAGEENGGREEEKENKEMEEGKDVGKRKGGGGRGGDGGNEKEGKEGNYGEEEKGNGKEKEEGNYEGAEKGNKEDEGKDGRKGEGEKGNKEDEGKDAGKGGGEKENKEGKDRGKGGEEGEKENKENEGKDAGKGEGAGEGEKDAKEKEEKGKEEEEKEEGKEAPPWKSSVALNGNLARNENLNGRPVVKVLLLAYQRSGSSFTGELLSSGGGAFYVYEPLFQWRHQFGYAPDPAFHQDIPKLLGDLLDCSPEVLNAWKRGNFRHFRRKPEGVKDFCKDASFRLVKTIRARKSHVLPWLLLREDIKVVHLVRDPRGILNSVSHGGNIWTDRNRDAVYQCTSLSEDLDLEQLGPQRYLRMRYEDLVDKPLEETTRVFSFMGVPVSSSVLTFLKEHTGMDTAGSPLKQRYMNTFRQADFRHDHWKKELDSQHIRQIEDVCQVVMNFLHYPVLPSA